MDNKTKKAVTDFIQGYIDTPPKILDRRGYIREDALRGCIMFFVKHRILSASAFKRELIRQKGIILPDKYYEGI